MTSLIVGITGCAGSHLAEYLLKKNYVVFGAKRKSSSLNNIRHIIDKIKLLDIDFNERGSIARVINQSKPEVIFYLAAANQFYKLEDMYKINVSGTINFFETLKDISPEGRIILVSSSAVYGTRKDLIALKEDAELLPSGHYGLSKLFQEDIGLFYYRNYKLDIIVARPFNFTGTREYPKYVCSDFAKQIVDIENGKREPVIKVGNLNNKRDFTDVRDIVKGFELLARNGKTGEIYNLCSGKAIAITGILEKLLSMSNAEIKIKTDPYKVGNGEPNYQVGDNSKIFSHVGWMPQISLDKSLKDLLDYIRSFLTT